MKLMPVHSKHNYNIAVLIAIPIIWVQNLVLKHIDVDVLQTTWGLLIASSATVVLSYKVALIIYEKYIWKKLSPEIDIAGSWHHVLTPHNKNPNKDISGRFTVDQTAFETKISGENFDEASVETSQWESEFVFQANKNLVMNYRIDEIGSSRKGVIKVRLHIDSNTNKAIKMTGQYGDIGASEHYGNFTASKE